MPMICLQSKAYIVQCLISNMVVTVPDEIADADEVFLTGTAAEVTPISEIGPHHDQVGPLTRTLMEDYAKEVRG